MKSRFTLKHPIFCAALLFVGACSGPPSVTSLAIVDATGAEPTSAVAGDVLQLTVVERLSDGTTRALPSGASVTWSTPSTVTSLSPGASGDSRLPPVGAVATGFFLLNVRTDVRASLSNALFVLGAGSSGAGSLAIVARVVGVADASSATTTVAVSVAPTGDATRGQSTYAGACATCHGETGHGSAAVAGSVPATYSLEGQPFAFPSPGLNAEPGNAGSDPDWSAAMFAIAARGDIDDGSVTLRAPMPSWLVTVDPATGETLTTQDFADIYAFMKTQTH